MEGVQGDARVVADDLRFRRKLAIGADSFTSVKVLKLASLLGKMAVAAALGAFVSRLDFIAVLFDSCDSIFCNPFGSKSETPLYGVIGFAVLFALLYLILSVLHRRFIRSRAYVIPKFVNANINSLGGSLMDRLGSLALYVAISDGRLDPRESACIREYFIEEWGFDAHYTDEALDRLLKKAKWMTLDQIVTDLTTFARRHPDCNFTVICEDFFRFLSEIGAADKEIHEREEQAFKAIEKALGIKR